MWPGAFKAGGRRVVGGVTVAEALGEDLIPDDAFGPFGHELIAHMMSLVGAGLRDCLFWDYEQRSPANIRAAHIAQLPQAGTHAGGPSTMIFHLSEEGELRVTRTELSEE